MKMNDLGGVIQLLIQFWKRHAEIKLEIIPFRICYKTILYENIVLPASISYHHSNEDQNGVFIDFSITKKNKVNPTYHWQNHILTSKISKITSNLKGSYIIFSATLQDKFQ